ncbi:hypothetical protein [Rubellicoccus peritrichatus]|uniref:Uncharacterized protein n=1 Tax=Rubellicoccus peritrichatus TaxID=3080537 RepID=A0AAQ3LFJ1_9BACT|nr:hypothetical protein [Puniceicoccus sp. CR14]WOO41089.1 hypothetical protein RZN69_20915 [Puniceicoccus sp. CR14]
MALLILLSFPASQLGYTIPVSAQGLIIDDILFLSLVILFPMPYATVAIIRSRNPLKNLINIPALMALMIGISINQSFAVIEALLGHKSSFVRTPKYGNDKDSNELTKRMIKYKSPFSIKTIIELVLCIYVGLAAFFFFRNGHSISGMSMLLATAGLGYIGVNSLIEYIRLAKARA